MVRSVAGQVNSLGLQGPDLERLVIVKETLKHTLKFIFRNTVLLAKEILNPANALANTDGRLVALHLREAVLKIRTRGQMVRMGMGFKDEVHFVAFILD